MGITYKLIIPNIMYLMEFIVVYPPEMASTNHGLLIKTILYKIFTLIFRKSKSTDNIKY